MNLKYFFRLICVLKLVMRDVEAKPKNTFHSSTKNKQLSQTVANFIDCCVHKKKITILLTDEMENLFALDSLRNNFALISLHGNEVLQKHKRLRDIYVLDDIIVRQKVSPVTTIIVAVSNANRLEKILEDLKDSIWWNHEANFIIVNRNEVNGCQLARSFLTITWTYNMISVLYICTRSNRNSLIYTFNPFTGSAPEFWNEVEDKSSNRYLTVFKSSFNQFNFIESNDNTILSRDLFFDKVKNLKSYNLKVALNIHDYRIYRYNTSKSGYDRYGGLYFRAMCTVLSYLNATVTVKFSSALNLLVNKKLYGMAKDAIQGQVDILMNGYILRDFWKIQAHSFDFALLKFVSLKTPVHYSNGLTSVFTFKVSILLVIINFVFVQMLKFVLKVSTSSAVLEFVRIFSQSTTLKEPRTSILRILLIILITAALAFSSYVQSLLKAISTTDNQFSTIDTVDDLLNCHLPTFAGNSHKELFVPKEILERINTLIDIESCFDRLRKGDQVVCVRTEQFIDYSIQRTDSIHISKDNLVEKSLAYVFAEDSPFLRKCNSILLKMNESGFMRFIFNREKEFHYRNKSYDDEKVTSSTSNLIYSGTLFYILAASWLLGVVVFCFELLIPKIRTFARKIAANLW